MKVCAKYNDLEININKTIKTINVVMINVVIDIRTHLLNVFLIMSKVRWLPPSNNINAKAKEPKTLPNHPNPNDILKATNDIWINTPSIINKSTSGILVFSNNAVKKWDIKNLLLFM